MQIREQLEQLIDAAVAAAMEDGSLPLEQAPEAALERPRDEGNGDWASTVALRSAKLIPESESHAAPVAGKKKTGITIVILFVFATFVLFALSLQGII